MGAERLSGGAWVPLRRAAPVRARRCGGKGSRGGSPGSGSAWEPHRRHARDRRGCSGVPGGERGGAEETGDLETEAGSRGRGLLVQAATENA